MEVSKKKIATGLLAVGVLFGSTGVYAGTLVERYKTPRGNIATVETENVHKNRIGISVNGKTVKTDTIYLNGATYAPIREVATMLNAGVNYNSQTMSADIFTNNQLLDLFGIKLNKVYNMKSLNSSISREFIITSFNPSSNEFEATLGKDKVSGYFTEKKMVYRDGGNPYEFTYNGATKQFVESRYWYAVTIE